MTTLRCRLRILTWVALVAVLALALLPTVSRAWMLAVPSHAAHASAEVCTAEGVRTLPATAVPSAPHDPVPGHHADAFDRCAHCVLGAAPWALAAVPAPWPATAAALQLVTLPRPGGLVARQIWGSAQPRAPPMRG